MILFQYLLRKHFNKKNFLALLFFVGGLEWEMGGIPLRQLIEDDCSGWKGAKTEGLLNNKRMFNMNGHLSDGICSFSITWYVSLMLARGQSSDYGKEYFLRCFKEILKIRYEKNLNFHQTGLKNSNIFWPFKFKTKFYIPKN